MVKIIRTSDQKRFRRAEREINLLKMFHKVKNICNIVQGTIRPARRGVLASCVCVLEYFELGTVQTLLDNGDSRFTERYEGLTCLRFNEAVAMAKDVLDGLKYMHEMNIVHRDIKPANICVEILPSSPHLRSKIIDLGCAVPKMAQPTASSGASSATSSLQVGFTGQFTDMLGLKQPLGTLIFMSPEQIDRHKIIDGRSDIFNLGVTLYKCLCGRFPFVEPNSHWDQEKLTVQLIVKFTSSAEASPLIISAGVIGVQVRDMMAALIAKAIRKVPTERFSSVSTMKAAIERIGRYNTKSDSKPSNQPWRWKMH